MSASTQTKPDQLIISQQQRQSPQQWRPINVLILGGWSPGPLWTIQRTFSSSNSNNNNNSNKSCQFYSVPMHMPPSGIRWCFTWEFALLLADITLSISILSINEWNIFLRILLFLSGIVLILPLCIVLLVRGSIRRCIQSAKMIIDRGTIDLVVGFSWGGGIGCFLLSQNIWRGPTLLLAPTIELMMKFAAMRPLQRHHHHPPLFVASNGASQQHQQQQQQQQKEEEIECLSSEEQQHPQNQKPPLVHIFHAVDDPFCPQEQIRALERTGAAMYELHDSHVFMERSSKAQICQSFAQLIFDL